MRVHGRDWTVLVYNAGQSNAGMSCTHNLLDMERVGSTDSCQIVCMNGRGPWVPEKLGLWRDYQGARTYELGPGTGKAAPRTELGKWWSFLKTSPARIQSPSTDQGNPNMGDPETLRSFLLENVAKYPSEHVAIVIGGHGAGFAGQAITHDPEGRITNEALAGVLADVQKQIGKKIDLVDFNNCYGASLEVMHPLRNSVECAVGSQSVQFGPTQPLGEVMRRLQENPDITGQELGMLFVDAAREQPLSNLSTRTLSAVDLSRLDPLADEVARLHEALQAVPPAQVREWLAQAAKDDYAPGLYNYDLGSVARVMAESGGPEVKAAAERVGAALREAVLAEQHADPSRDGIVAHALNFLFRPDLPGEASGLSVHYETDVTAPGNRLAQVKDTELGLRLGIEPFLQFLSRTDRRTAAAPASPP